MSSAEDYNTAKRHPKTIFILKDQINNTIKFYNANGIYKVIKKRMSRHHFACACRMFKWSSCNYALDSRQYRLLKRYSFLELF